MTNEEAIRVLNVARVECEWNAPLDYQTAFDVAIESIEKQISKKPEDLKPVKNAAGHIFSKSGKCPCCGEAVEYYCNSWVCDFCGQAIDWREEE